MSKVLGVDKLGSPKEQCEKWFEWTFDRYKNDQEGQNILIDKSTNKIIGQSGLLVREMNEIKEIEVAYSILPNSMQKEFASEVAKKCGDYAFQNNFSQRLISIIKTKNHNSAKVALNNGMLNNRTIDFHGNPVHIYQITIDEWKELHK